MKNLFVSLVCLVFFLSACSMNQMGGDAASNRVESLGIQQAAVSTDYREPSSNPPGGLKVSEVPQFVVLGYDDNQFDDGVINTMNMIKGKTNPAGSGNPLTFDGAPLTASYYNNPAGRNDKEEWTVAPETVVAWKAAHDAGHETANHTYYHEHGLAFDTARWVDEMTRTNEFFATTVGIPASDVIGFRTPFLEYNLDTFYAMQQVGLTYDCSFEGGRIYWPRQDGSNLLWPYTMDNGTPANESGRPLPKVPGMWQLPQDCLYTGHGQFMTGFDWNLWFQYSYTAPQFVAILKDNLNLKYNGNRAPMMVGLHSNYYSDKGYESMKKYSPDAVAKLKTTTAERIAALQEFIDYAHSLPDVRIVSAKQMLQWLRNPVPMKPTLTFDITATAGPNGTVVPAGINKVPEGQDFTVTAKPAAGYSVDKVTVDGAPATLDANKSYTFKAVKKDHTIDVTFAKAETFLITATAGPNGKWDKVSPIEVVKGDSVTLTALPDAGYKVASITVGTNAPITGKDSYTFTNVQANDKIHVEFEKLPPAEVEVTYTITQDWGSGFGANVTIHNKTTAPINNWKLAWTYKGDDRVTSLWNATFVQTGKTVEVTNVGWNGTIAPGAKVSFGFNGAASGPAEVVKDFTLIQQ